MNTKLIFVTFCVIIRFGILQAYEDKQAQTEGKRKATGSPGKVYLLTELNPDGSKSGYYKIGKTTQEMKKRISDLQGGNARKIEEVESHEVSDMDEAEKRAQDATKQWNTKESHGGGSEWFYVPSSDYNDFHKKFVDAVENKQAKRLVSLLKAMMRMI